MKEDVLATKVANKCKKINLMANTFFILMIFGTVGFNYYEEYRKDKIYNSLLMTFASATEIEYGTANYDTMDLVESVDGGEITNYTQEIDTSTIGVQKLTYEVEMEDVSKEFSIQVEVVDTKKPVIELKKKTINLYTGSSYDIKSNIVSVTDEVDGELVYKENPDTEVETGYYTITSNYNKNKVGNYEVTVKAVDINGIEEEASYEIKVTQKPKPKAKTIKVQGSYTGPSSVDTSSVINAAKSLIGSKYRYAGNSPAKGFDCSGFIQYIYSLFGKSLSKTASGLAKNGSAVSRVNMQPGDIIVWSTKSNNRPTHVSLYIGNDTMIHAANTRDGVIKSSVSFWEKHGGGHIVTIRRV